MHMFEALFNNVKTTDTGVEFSFEDIRFNLTNSQIELDYEISAMENYFAALDRLDAVCASIESFDGKLDDGVREFIDHNGEISAALGICLEEDQTSNGEQVKDKADKNIFQKAWDAICRFFKTIWNKICDFFRWIGNGFKSLPKKIDAAQKKFAEMTPEEREKFLNDSKTDVSPNTVADRFEALTQIIQILSANAEGTIEDVMFRYYTKPSSIYPKSISAALAKYNIRLIDETGRDWADVMADGSLSFVNKCGKYEVKVKDEAPVKSFKEMGWNESAVQNLFAVSQKACDAADGLEKLVNNLLSAANNMSSDKMKESFENIKQQNKGILNAIFHHSRGKRIDASSAETYRKGLNTICNIYRGCLTAIRTFWKDDNRILDAFRNSPKENADAKKA